MADPLRYACLSWTRKSIKKERTAYRLPNAADTGKLEFKPVVMHLRFWIEFQTRQGIDFQRLLKVRLQKTEETELIPFQCISQQQRPVSRDDLPHILCSSHWKKWNRLVGGQGYKNWSQTESTSEHLEPSQVLPCRSKVHRYPEYNTLQNVEDKGGVDCRCMLSCMSLQYSMEMYGIAMNCKSLFLKNMCLHCTLYLILCNVRTIKISRAYVPVWCWYVAPPFHWHLRVLVQPPLLKLTHTVWHVSSQIARIFMQYEANE